MESFLRNWHNADPAGFVKALSVSSRQRHLFGTSSERLLGELIRLAQGITETYRIEPSFFDSTANCFLVAAITDALHEFHHGEANCDDAFRLAQDAAGVVIGGHGATADVLRNLLADPDDDIDPERIDQWRQQLEALAGTGGIEQTRQRLLTNPSHQTQVLSTAMAAKDVDAISRIRKVVGESAFAIRWAVLSDARFRGATTPALGLPAHGESPGVIVVADALAKRLITDRLRPDDAQTLGRAHLEAAYPSTAGLDDALFGVAKALRDERILSDASLTPPFSGASLEHTFAMVLESVADADIFDAVEQPTDKLTQHLVDSMGLRHTLLFALLHPAQRSDAFVTVPGMDHRGQSDRYGAFIESLTERQIEVRGWQELARSCRGLVDEINQRSCDADDFVGITAKTLSMIFTWDVPNAQRNDLARVMEPPAAPTFEPTPARDTLF